MPTEFFRDYQKRHKTNYLILNEEKKKHQVYLNEFSFV
jgi:hypothetical protein